MTKISPLLSSQILETIKNSHKILLHCHPFPDEDSVGSALAMYQALLGLGKKTVVISGDSGVLKNLSFLPGFKEIEEKNFFEVNLEEFDLFIILDSASPEMISQLNKVTFPSNLKTIVIDHHDSNSGFGDINLIDSSYPATCQMLYDLFKEWGITITPEIAACLLAGIYADTGGFQYNKTSLETLEVTCFLARLYPDFRKVFQATRKKLNKEILKLRSLAYNNLEILFDGQVVISEITLKDLEKSGVDKKIISLNNVSDELQLVAEWKIVITLIEKEEGIIKVSLRAQEDVGVDLSQLAALLGGGGHKLAAGAVVKKSLEETKNIILENLPKLYPWLAKK